jgi:predicted ribosomally synthesized peptide with SipW-like signal peptide
MGLVAVALLVCLGVMGVGYAAWTDTDVVNGTVETGSWIGSLSDPVPTSANITLSVVPPDILSVSVSYAQADADYTGIFEVSNTGTVPIRIASIGFSLPPNVTADISEVSEGDQIEPGETKYADVTTSTSIEGNAYSFTVAFAFAVWNE